VRFDVGGVNHLRVGGSPVPGKLPEQVFPNATPRPAHEAVIDRRRRTISFRADEQNSHARRGRLVSPAAIARVGSSYDGAWNLLFVTHAELANIRVMNALIEGGKPTDKMPIGT
jgi:hypothetical protein